MKTTYNTTQWIINSICYVHQNLGLFSMEMNDCCQLTYFAEYVLFTQINDDK